MSTKTYQLPPAYYADHRARDCGESGRVIHETKRRVTVELDAVAYLDLVSDCKWFIETASLKGGFDGFSPIGLRRSAEATLRILEADPFTDGELEAGRLEWDRRQAEQRELDRLQGEELRRQAEQRELERREYEAAHPRLRAEYYAFSGFHRKHVIGLESNEDLKVGSIIVTETLVSLEIIELGEVVRHKIAATVRNIHTDEELEVQLELGRINP